MDLTDELLDNLPGGDRQDVQAIIICLHFPIGKFENKRAVDAIFELADIFQNVIETSQNGVYKGHEFYRDSEGEGVTFYLLGHDVREIYKEIKPILQSLPTLQAFTIIKQYAQFTDGKFQLPS